MWKWAWAWVSSVWVSSGFYDFHDNKYLDLATINCPYVWRRVYSHLLFRVPGIDSRFTVTTDVSENECDQLNVKAHALLKIFEPYQSFEDLLRTKTNREKQIEGRFFLPHNQSRTTLLKHNIYKHTNKPFNRKIVHVAVIKVWEDLICWPPLRHTSCFSLHFLALKHVRILNSSKLWTPRGFDANSHTEWHPKVLRPRNIH